MADTPIDGRKFTDREVREILKKAVEATPSRALQRSEGLSLAELKAIGEEVGIDPARLEEAARAVTLRGGNPPNRILGAPMVLNFERTVEGELDPEDTLDALTVIRRTMGRQGDVDEIHGSLEWTVNGELGERSVTLASRDGTTAIRSSANLGNAAVLTYVPAGVIGLLTAMVGLIKFFKDGSVAGLVVCLVVALVLYPILRTVFSRISDSESARLQQVVDELARLPKGR